MEVMKMNINFTFKPVKNNNYSRHGEAIKYIVVHDTGNSNRGAGAMAHFNYVNTNSRGASAHYFVDDKGIVQFVGDSRSAGAVGDGKGRFGITNRNSISVEMCINSDGDYNKTYFTTVELVKNLMVKFKVPADRVVRHYDASRKSCPNHMRIDKWAKWWKFKEDIKRPMVVKIDLSKDSVNKPLVNVDKAKDPSSPEEIFINKIYGCLKGKKLNVLPSVTIAQAILESNWGKSSLALEANNLFGIKDSSDWTGEVYRKTTKEQKPDGKVYSIEANFRKYESMTESIIDHDKFFVSSPWRANNYSRVLRASNYKDQAQALKDCGYATDLNYPSKLIGLVEKYKLDKFDKENDIMDNNKPSKWAEKEWEEGTKLGITDGSNPKKPATREEVVAMIVRAMKK